MKQVIVAYIPALHSGYTQLFRKYPGSSLYLVSRNVSSKFRPLVKDLRALEPVHVKPAIESWKMLASVQIAGAAELEAIGKTDVEIIMPDEDISHDLAAEYFAGHKVEYSPVFLRWDRRRSEAQEAAGVGHAASSAQADKDLMQLANQESWSSSDIWRRVGALIVKDGQVILHGYNRAQPTDITPWVEGDPRNNFGKGVAIEMSLFMHAEAGLVAEAARTGTALEGTSMYVTTFPCPNCAKLIANAGIKKCYYAAGYAMLDGNRILETSAVEIIKVDVLLEDQSDEVWVPYPQDT